MSVDSYRARARRKTPRPLRLETTVTFTATATLQPAPLDLVLQSTVAMGNVATLTPSATLQLSTLIPFTATASLMPDDGSLQLDAPIAMDNTATLTPSATLQLDAPIPITADTTIVPSATLQLASLIPYTATASLVADTPELVLQATVAQVNTARIAAQLKLAATVAQTNRATLRGSLALRAPIPISNSATLTGTLPPNVVLVPLSIDHTGATDVTALLQAVIDSTGPGDEIRFPVTVPPAKYRLDSHLQFTNRFGGPTFTGNGATLLQPMAGTITDGVISDGVLAPESTAPATPLSGPATANSRLATAAGGFVPNVGPVFPIGFAPGAGTPTHAEIDDMVDRWNAKVLRCGISWDAMSSGVNGIFDQTTGADDFVSYCCSKGVGVIFQVGSGTANNGKMFVPATIIKFAQFCRAVMARYNGTTFASGKFVLSVSVGNEPNHAKWDDGVASGVGDDGKGAAYAEQMIRIADPLFNNARAIPNCPPIQIGGLGGESFRVGIPSSLFTQQAYASITVDGHTFPQGWKTAYDVFDQHPYSYPVLASNDTSDGWWQMVNVIRPLMVTYGDAAKPVCISEIGFPTNPNTPAEYEKAKLGLIDAVYEATKLGYIDSFCWFSWMNNNKTGLPPGANDNYFGIVLNNPVPSAAVPKTGTTTPGYAATFAELAAGTVTPPPTDATPLPVILGLCAAGTTSNAANVGARPAGCKLKRIDINWWGNQGTNPGNAAAGLNDTFTFANLDAILTAADANGYQVIGMCGYTPPWAGGDGVTGHGYPRGAAQNYPDYANFCRAVAARAEATHPGTLIATEFWNEPNQEFLTPNSVANFAKLCQGAQDAIKNGVVVGRANRTPYPQIITIAGGTGAAPAVGNQFRHLNWTRSLVQTAPRCADHFGIHAYSGGCVLNTNNNYDPARNDIPQIRTALNGAGRADAQIVNTESGSFTRLDSTPTNTGDSANCGRYGTGAGDAAKQVTVTGAAQLLTADVAWWMTNAATYKLGPFLYYEQDNSQAADLFNSAGLYTNPAGNYNGAAKTNTAGTPVLLNAFIAAGGATVVGNQLASATATFLPHITGATVTGTGIPAGTTVTYLNAHTVALSKICTKGSGLTVNVNPGFYAPGYEGFWSAQNCAGLQWHDFTMLGGHINAGTSTQGYASDGAQGFNFVSVRNFEIDNCTIRQTFGDFAYCTNGEGALSAPQYLTSGRIHHSTFDKSGRQAIPLQGVDGIEIDNCTIGNSARSIFDLEPNDLTEFNLNIDIHDNNFGAHRLLFLAASGGVRACPFDNVNIHDNSASSPYSMDIAGQDLLDAVTAAALPPCTYANGAAGVGATLTANADGVLPPVDGIVVPLGGRIHMNHMNAIWRGPYRVTNRGSTTTPWVLTRLVGSDTATTLPGRVVFIRSGETLAHTGWRLGAAPIVVGTDNLFWAQYIASDPTLPALTRTNFRFANNTTTGVAARSPGAVFGIAYVDGVTVTGNDLPCQAGGGPMRVAKLTHCTNYDVSGNTGANLTGQFTSDTVDPGMRALPGPLYGVTFDSDAGATAAKLDPQFFALSGLPHMPIVRLVVDPNETPSRYTAAVNRFKPISYLMLMPADSTALKKYTLTPGTAVAEYAAQFNLFLDTFETTVDLWEIGNELGGGWTYDHALGKTGGQNLVRDMVTAAYNAVAARGKRIALTLWENNWGTNLCGAGPAWDMTPQQFSALLSPTVRNNVDYLLISWYPTQCTGRPSNNIPVAEIQDELDSLHLLYPNARIGFGELGLPLKISPATLAAAKSLVTYYYPLDPHRPYYCGGYLWWYFQQDMTNVEFYSALQLAMA